MAGGVNILAAIAILGTVPAAVSLIWSWQQKHVRAGGLCRKCDYPLKDLEPRADGRFLCPECGLVQTGRAHASHRVGHLLDFSVPISSLIVLGLPIAICAVLRWRSSPTPPSPRVSALRWSSRGSSPGSRGWAFAA
ncbi:MAG: hypothetical protein V9F04_01235 [Dermatophilaceae bacterium]